MPEDKEKCREIIKEDRSGIRRIAIGDEKSGIKKVSKPNAKKEK